VSDGGEDQGAERGVRGDRRRQRIIHVQFWKEPSRYRASAKERLFLSARLVSEGVLGLSGVFQLSTVLVKHETLSTTGLGLG